MLVHQTLNNSISEQMASLFQNDDYTKTITEMTKMKASADFLIKQYNDGQIKSDNLREIQPTLNEVIERSDRKLIPTREFNLLLKDLKNLQKTIKNILLEHPATSKNLEAELVLFIQDIDITLSDLRSNHSEENIKHGKIKLISFTIRFGNLLNEVDESSSENIRKLLTRAKNKLNEFKEFVRDTTPPVPAPASNNMDYILIGIAVISLLLSRQ